MVTESAGFSTLLIESALVSMFDPSKYVIKKVNFESSSLGYVHTTFDRATILDNVFIRRKINERP